MKVKDALKWGSVFLRNNGFSVSAADEEARLFLARASAQEVWTLLLEPEKKIAAEVWHNYLSNLQKRVQGEPVHYLLGEKEFMSLTFRVGPQVLIPRQDTEVLVEKVWEFLEPWPEPLVLDLGTGSGVIAISLAYYLPKVHLIATDLSAAALQIARENARRHGVLERIEFLKGDRLAPLEPGLKFTALVANPPYLTKAEMAALVPEVKKEPSMALYGGVDGLFFYRYLAKVGKNYLQPEGKLFVEIGWRQGQVVQALFREAGWEEIELVHDLVGRERVVVAG